MFGSMSCEAHQAYIALSEPMTSIVQQGSSLGSCPISLSINPHYKPTFGSLNLCQLLSEGSQWQIPPSLAPRKWIRYLPHQHGVCVSTTKPSFRMWGLRPYHQPKQKMWNPTTHSRRPSAANQTNHSLFFFSFKQFFSELISESLTIPK